MGGLHRDFISLLKTFSTAYSETLRTSAGILPLGGSHKDLFSLFRTFNTAYCKILPARCAAFTLAEVLITLGIIGVVAAMTMPTLIQNHRKHEVEVRLKKFYSVMNQAILMAKKDYGEFSDWYSDYNVEQSTDEEGNFENKTTTINESFNKYLVPYLNIVANKDVDTEKGVRTLHYLADGSAFSYPTHTTRDIEFFPKNAEKCLQLEETSERYGKCSFAFIFSPINTFLGDWKYHSNKGLEPYMYRWSGEIDNLYSNSRYGCKDGEGTYCTALIQQNGWKIPNDYPRKLSY